MPSQGSGPDAGQRHSLPSWPVDADALFQCFVDILEGAFSRWRESPGTLAVLIRCEDWQDGLEAARALLSGPERNRADRQRRPQDRTMHVLAYAFHRMSLAWAMGLSPGSVPLVRDDMGCPRLPGTAWHTSLSHADGSVALAMSCEGPVGIDLESRDKAASMPELIDSVCTMTERQRLLHDPAAIALPLLELWVRKEALLKACGLGMSLEMRSIEAPADDWVPLPEDGREVRLRMLPAGDGHVAALASVTHGALVVGTWLAPAATPG